MTDELERLRERVELLEREVGVDHRLARLERVATDVERELPVVVLEVEPETSGAPRAVFSADQGAVLSDSAIESIGERFREYAVVVTDDADLRVIASEPIDENEVDSE